VLWYLLYMGLLSAVLILWAIVAFLGDDHPQDGSAP